MTQQTQVQPQTSNAIMVVIASPFKFLFKAFLFMCKVYLSICLRVPIIGAGFVFALLVILMTAFGGGFDGYFSSVMDRYAAMFYGITLK